MLEATLLFGGLRLRDQHSDLRLDVDNMSYEVWHQAGHLSAHPSLGSMEAGVLCDVLWCFQRLYHCLIYQDLGVLSWWNLILCCNTEVISVAFIGCGGTLQELLALEDRIGNVSTGLTAEAVAEKLKRSCYSSLDVVGAQFSQEYDTKCSICQVQLISWIRLFMVVKKHEVLRGCFLQVCMSSWFMLH